MQLPVTLIVRPSVQLAALLTLIHCIALAVVVTIALPLPFKAALIAAIVISALRYAYRGALQHDDRSVVGLTLDRNGELELERKNGARSAVDVAASTCVTSFCVVLVARDRGRRIALTLPRDALGFEAHRQLRLWLRNRDQSGSRDQAA